MSTMPKNDSSLPSVPLDEQIRFARRCVDDYERLLRIWEDTLQRLTGGSPAARRKDRPIDQIIELIRKIGHPITAEALAEEAVAAGIGMGDSEGRRLQAVKEVIRRNSIDNRTKKHLLKAKHGKVGLPEWEDARFR